MAISKNTPFSEIYDSFFSRVTDDMYLLMTEFDLFKQLQDILINALPRFKMPKFNIFDYEEGNIEDLGTYNGVLSDGITVPASGWIGGTFNHSLSVEEINILSMAMMIEWFGQQIAVIENTKLKASGQDYKFSSQANHMAKLKVMMDKYAADCKSLQDTYKRRKIVNGKIVSTLGQIMEVPNYGYKI